MTVGLDNVPLALLAADLDGDSRKELVVYVKASAGSIMTVLTNDGSGTFSTSFTTPAAGSYPDSAVAIDLNADDKIDLASVNHFNNSLTVLTNDGSGTFTAASTNLVVNGPVFWDPDFVTAEDVNGDGKPDLICANARGNNLSILLNSPAEPTLSVRLTGNNELTLYWSAAVPEFMLQQQMEMTASNWSSVSNSVTTVSGVNQVTLPMLSDRNFFRLIHP